MHRQISTGAVVYLALLTGLGETAPAQDMSVGPTYSRLRAGADDWQARGGRYGHGGHYGPGYGNGYYQPYISPIVAGSWYARPYPYHFDYFQGRWAGRGHIGSPSDCPCSESLMAEEVIEPEATAGPTPAN